MVINGVPNMKALLFVLPRDGSSLNHWGFNAVSGINNVVAILLRTVLYYAGLHTFLLCPTGLALAASWQHKEKGEKRQNNLRCAHMACEVKTTTLI